MACCLGGDATTSTPAWSHGQLCVTRLSYCMQCELSTVTRVETVTAAHAQWASDISGAISGCVVCSGGLISTSGIELSTSRSQDDLAQQVPYPQI
jgi:hypothetical protein